MSIEKKSTSWRQTAGNFAAIVTAVITIIGGYYKIDEMNHERRLVEARTVMEETIQEAGLVTAAQFNEYVKSEENRHRQVEGFTLDYMATVDSSLFIVLPALAEIDKSILGRLSLIEAKIDANAEADTESAIRQVWEYLDEQAAKDSTEASNNELMRELRAMRRELVNRPKFGDRIE